MRARPIALLLFASSLIATVALGQTAALEVTRLEGALALAGTISRSSDHACSQSFASSHATATLGLAIDAHDAATLRIDVTAREVFGPSPGRYRSGEHDFTQTTELTRAVLTGRATRVAGLLTVRFARVVTSSVRFTGYGTLPLPEGTTSNVAITATCRLAPADVLPAVPATGEQPTRLRLVSCALEPVAALEGFETTELVFGNGVGVRVATERPMWDPDAPRVVRHVRAP